MSMAEYNQRKALDRVLQDAVGEAANELSHSHQPFEELREECLRQVLQAALKRHLPESLVAEDSRSFQLSRFQGVGPFDLPVIEEGLPVCLGELKWSTSLPRDKIYEAAWDAVKLALALDEHLVQRAWLVTGASSTAWAECETPDLFADGTVEVPELWKRALRSRGSNGGGTVGEDCELGGRGNMFTDVPSRLRVTRLASERIPAAQGEDWLLRAARIVGEGPMVAFAPPPAFPASINQGWLDRNVPSMDAATYTALLQRLRTKRWTEKDIDTRVEPLRRTPNLEDEQP
jgi:hypothetical protein